MLLQFVFLIASLSILSVDGQSWTSNTIYARNYSSKLDHFVSGDFEPIQLTYSYNTVNTTRNSTVFVLINTGEVNETAWHLQSVIRNVAKSVGGTTVSFYPRFFGRNTITEDSSLENLQFLTIDQSLADIAILVNGLRQNYTTERVILVGSGYGANLATWARQKFPHLVFAVWSSSGNFNRSLVTEEPYQELTKIIQQYGSPGCARNLSQIFSIISTKLQKFEMEYIRDTFQLCDRVFPHLDYQITLFVDGLINIIADYFNSYSQSGINHFCQSINNTNNVPLEQKLANWIKSIRPTTECLDYNYERYFKNVTDTNWTSSFARKGIRQLAYLHCTQLVNHPITIPGNTFQHVIKLEYYKGFCTEAFGRNFNSTRSTEILNEVSIYYGNPTPGIHRAIFTNGLQDLYHNLGVSVGNNATETYVFNIERAGRSTDLNEKYNNIGTDTLRTKNQIFTILSNWAKIV